MGGRHPAAMPESASLWEQPDLLALAAGETATSVAAVPAAAAIPAAAPLARRRPAPSAAAKAATAAPTAAAAVAPPAAAPAASDPAAAAAHAAVPGAGSPPAVPDAPALKTSSGFSGTAVAAGGSSPSVAASDPDPPCPQRLLILDTETTALSPSDGQCIEVGAVLFHVPSRSVLTQVSFLLPCPSNPAEAVNGIAAAVSRLEQPLAPALACFEAMAAAADAVLAHNAAFDRQWFGHGRLPPLALPWICSMEDIRWPPERQLRPNPSVRDLALAYGIPVWAAHRALTDCIYLAQVLERCSDLESLLPAALQPRQLYRARLAYAERHQAKAAGFRWNHPVPGAWSRRLSAAEAAALPFPVEPVAADEQRSPMPRDPDPLPPLNPPLPRSA